MPQISHVNLPNISGKTTDQALQILCAALGDAIVKIMELNNEVEELRVKIKG